MPKPELKPETIERLLSLGRPPSRFDDAFTERVLEQIRRQGLAPKPSTEPQPAERGLAVFKYSLLKDYMEIKATVLPKPTLKPFVMPEDPAKQAWEEALKEAVQEELLRPVPNPDPAAAQFEVTEQGRRWVADYERDQKTVK
jgi:hypothetical protein